MQLRREYLDPLFEFLGWDVANRNAAIDLYKEVVHDESLHFGKTREAPDYTFKFGGRRLFFAEAKRPSIDLLKSPDSAFQIRSYGWNAKLPICLLTNFRQILVYDCRQPPRRGDDPHVGLRNQVDIEDIASNWRLLADLFSRDAVLSGSLERARLEKRKLTREVDAKLLDDIEQWRELLAIDVAARNPTLSARALNFAVSMLIDRLVFLKICEDRGIEAEGRLLEASRVPDSYESLFRLFYDAERKYGSSLFCFHANESSEADSITPRLLVDHKALARVIRELYAEYDFAIIPPEILGAVYERFLGKRITLNSAHRVVIQKKPEVRKKSGVYYTPFEVVRRMLDESLAQQLDVEDLRSITTFKVLDPACGSGSFLLASYETILRWYLDKYLSSGVDTTRGKIFQDGPTSWSLTLRERTRILRNHIFGVDIDPQAVEVTKLSLLLKALETRDRAVIELQPSLISEPLLPGLDSNIKCGNALVEADFFHGEQLSLIDEERRYAINAFSWEGFKPADGFKLVIGNPPYVLLQGEFRDDKLRTYLVRKYRVAAYKVDLYHLFFERSLQLSNPRGAVCLITPTNYLTNNYLVRLRRLLVESGLSKVIIIDGNVFPDAAVDTAVSTVERGSKPEAITVEHLSMKHKRLLEHVDEIPVKQIMANPFALITGANEGVAAILAGLKDSVPLGQMFFVKFGKQLRDRDIYGDDVLQLDSQSLVPVGYERCFTGDNLSRFVMRYSGLACRTDRSAKMGGCWDDRFHHFSGKLLCRQVAKVPEFAIDMEGVTCLNTLFMIIPKRVDLDPWAFLALLNSKFTAVVWADQYYDQRGTYPKVKGTYLKRLPIPDPDREPFQTHNEELRQMGRRLYDLALDSDTLMPLEARHRGEERQAIFARIDQICARLFGLSEAHEQLILAYKLPDDVSA